MKTIENMSEQERKMKEKAKNSSTFCPLPFTHIASKTDGDTKLCCRSRKIGNINENSFEEIWNGDNYKRVRRQLLNSERPKECNNCWSLEDMNVRSMRERTLSQTGIPDILNDLSDDYSLPIKLDRIELKMSNLCQLKCRMCHPGDSTQWSKDWKHIHHLAKIHNTDSATKVEQYDLMNKPYMNEWEHNEQWWNTFKEKIAPNVNLVEFAGGEPLIDPAHYRVLDLLLPYADRVTIKYSTSLIEVEKALKIWNNFKKVNVYVSIDGVYDTYDYIRQLGDYNTIKANIEKVRNHSSVYQFRAAITFQMYNIMFLPEIFDTMINENKIGIHTHKVQWPEFLDMRVMPEHIKSRIAKELLSYYDTIDQKDWSKLDKKIAKDHIMENHNFLISKDMSYLLPQFVEYSDKLDVVQNVKKTWRELMPELSDHVNG